MGVMGYLLFAARFSIDFCCVEKGTLTEVPRGLLKGPLTEWYITEVGCELSLLYQDGVQR